LRGGGPRFWPGNGPCVRRRAATAARMVTMVTLRLTPIGPSLFVIVLDEGGRGLALVASLARSGALSGWLGRQGGVG
jgi:hypothetical protein